MAITPNGVAAVSPVNVKVQVGTGEEEQLVWVYCESQQETDDVLSFCWASQRPRRPAVDLKSPGSKAIPRDWRALVRSSLPQPPLPYSSAEREDFWSDAGALLAASSAAVNRRNRAPSQNGSVSASSTSSGQSARWPSLLVTDREKLCRAAAAAPLRSALAEVAQLRESDVLTVVLAADFGVLCGVLVVGAPMECCTSLFLGGSAGRGQGIADSPAEDSDVGNKAASSGSRHVRIQFGVFMQRPSLANMGGEDVLSGTAAGDITRFGARCLAILADGKCSYSAVSPDGARIVEADGRWEVVNGQLVITGAWGASGSLAKVCHMRLAQGGAAVLPIAYQEPIHFSLEELESDFEKPLALADCVPKGGDLLRLQIDEDHKASIPGGVSSRPAASGSAPTEAAVLSAALDATFHTAWDTVAGPEVAAAAATGVQTTTAWGSEPQGAHFLRTSVHALLSLASPETRAPDSDTSVNSSIPAPRLMGLHRGITSSLSSAHMVWEEAYLKTPNGKDSLPQQWFALSTSGSKFDADLERSFPVCILQPGIYTFESGSLKEYAHKKLEMTLHADGGCDYHETGHQGNLLRSVTGLTVWRVSDSKLILDSRKSRTHSFIWREARGSRSLERRVGRVELPAAVVLTCCSFVAFDQQTQPFPGHCSLAASRRIFGVIDPESPALRGLRCRPDRLPYHAFERELRRQGLPVDEILSDFVFVDRDSDMQVSVADMRQLETYGSPVAAPEVLEELREVLVKRRFGSLAAAFEALSASAGAGRVTAPEFERFLASQAQGGSQDPVRPPGPGARSCAPGSQSGDKASGDALKAWVLKTKPEDQAAVFASLNPAGGAAIDLPDFLCLSLHSAVLAVRRLQHFQSWVFEEFGCSAEVFRKVFQAFGPSDGKLTRKEFLEGAKALGYLLETRAIRSMFSLLDRNFDGEVSSKDFLKLRDFNGEDLLRDLEALKQFVEAKLGGIDACFGKFLERERSMQGLSGLPKTASYDAFQKICSHAGFTKLGPKADLKVVFLFLSEASGKQANGFMGKGEWSLLKGFNSKAITGSPARLRRILQERYGSVDNAFQKMHTAWLRRALAKGLSQTALAGMVNALLGPKSGERSGEPSSVPRSASGQGSRSGARDRALGSHGSRSKAAALRPPPRPSSRNTAAAGSSEQRPSTNARPLPNVIPLPSRGLSPPERRSPPPPSGSLVPGGGLPSGAALGRPSSASHGPAMPGRHKLIGLLPRSGPTAQHSRQGPVSAIDWSVGRSSSP